MFIDVDIRDRLLVSFDCYEKKNDQFAVIINYYLLRHLVDSFNSSGFVK